MGGSTNEVDGSLCNISKSKRNGNKEGIENTGFDASRMKRDGNSVDVFLIKAPLKFLGDENVRQLAQSYPHKKLVSITLTNGVYYEVRAPYR